MRQRYYLTIPVNFPNSGSRQIVKGGVILGQGVSRAIINVRTYSSREISAVTAEIADIAGEARLLMGEGYASSGSSEAWDAAFSRLCLSLQLSPLISKMWT